jgi:hypothetical protein
MAGVKYYPITITIFHVLIYESEWVGKYVLMQMSFRSLPVVLPMCAMPDEPGSDPIFVKYPTIHPEVNSRTFQDNRAISWTVAIIEPMIATILSYSR